MASFLTDPPTWAASGALGCTGALQPAPCCLSPLRPGPRCLALRDTWLPPPGWGAPWGQGSSLCPIPQTQGLALGGEPRPTWREVNGTSVAHPCPLQARRKGWGREAWGSLSGRRSPEAGRGSSAPPVPPPLPPGSSLAWSRAGRQPRSVHPLATGRQCSPHGPAPVAGETLGGALGGGALSGPFGRAHSPDHVGRCPGRPAYSFLPKGLQVHSGQ